MTGALLFMITGCSQDAKTIDITWTCGEGNYILTLDANQWKVEEEDDETRDFQKKDDEDFRFSVTKWENLYFVEGFDFDAYYEYFVDGIAEQYPGACGTGMEIMEKENMTIVAMGVQYEIMDELYHVNSGVISADECSDSLFYMSMYPVDGNENLDTGLSEILSGVQFTK